MMIRHALALVSCAGLAALATPSSDGLRYAPAADVPLVKSWTAEHILTMQSFTSQVGDEPVVTYPVTGKMNSKQTLVVSDTLRELGEGRPAVLERRFDRIRSEATLNVTGEVETERKARLESKLEGAEVRYTWVPEEDTYGKFFHAEEGDEASLAPLGEDMDLRCVLPKGPVEVGATWQFATEDLVHLLAPCGEVQLRTAEDSDRRLARSVRFGLGGGLEYAFNGKSQAECNVTWKEVRAVDGRSCAVLELAVDGRFLGAKSEILGEDVLMGEALRGARIDRFEIALRVEGRGEVLWDLENGRAHSMELALAEDATLRVFEEGPDGADVAQNLSMRGLAKIGYSVEEPVAAGGPLLEDANRER